MYISRIFLNGRKHDTARAMNNPEIFHGALERCFAGERQHPLWRIDGTNGNLQMLVVSQDRPDYTHFLEQFGYLSRPAEVKDYDLFLKRGFKSGDVLRFRFVGNPTVKKDGKRIPLNKNRSKKYPYCAVDWACDRIKKNGAEVSNILLVSYGEKVATAEKGERKIKFVVATFEGILKITDVNKFADLLAKGIGHEKAFGCGLISVMRM